MYSIEGVRQLCRNGAPRDANLGSGANTTDGQHAEAVDFWQKALALDGPEKLSTGDAEYARAEIARHQAAMTMNVLPDFSVAGRMRAARDGRGMSLESLADWVGRANGGSAMSQITDKIAFWQAALACEDSPGKKTLTPSMRKFAEAELARQQAALERMQPKIAPRRHTWEPV